MQNKYNSFGKLLFSSGGFLSFVSYTLVAALIYRFNICKRACLTGLFTGLLFAFNISHASATDVYTFDIPKQSLSKSLNDLSTQTGTLVLFAYDLVEKHEGNPVKGTYTLIDAMNMLLHDTGLEGGLTKKDVIMISQTHASKLTDNNIGNNNMNTKKTTIATAVAVLLSGAAATNTVNAQEESAADDNVEKISVLGTRGTPRTITNSPVAVDVISGEEFTANGNTADITDNLKALVPSFTASPATGDGSAFIRPTSLRGMAPDQTLVLVNGKRRHRSSLVQFFAPAAGNGAHGVDIGMIPSIALKNVEILRDGAAAQYGSDAIAGVMNFQLKDASEGGSVIAQYGNFYEGEQSWIVGANAGFALGTDGFFNVSFETNDNEALSRGIQRPDAELLDNSGVSGVGADSPFGDAPLVQTWGRPETSGTRLAFNSGYEISDMAELYMHGGYASTDGRYRFFYRNPNHSSLTDVNTLPAGYTPFLDGAQKDFSLVAGVRGETDSELTYDISLGTGKNELAYFLNNTVNPGLVVNGDPGQRDFDMGGYEQAEFNLNADFSMPLSDDVFLGFGAEYREETFTTIAGEEAARVSPGTSGLSAVGPADAGEFSRDNIAIYGDLEYFVSDDFLVQTALRYEDFSDFGSTINGKVAARYNVSDDLVLRGSFSTGFHAPTPGQANVSTIITTFDGSTGLQVEEGLLPTNSAVAIANGATQLKEEESVSFSFGFTYSAFDRGNLAVDLYSTDVDDRIYRTGDIPQASGGSVSFFTNALDVKHQGLDIVYTDVLEWNDDLETKLTFAFNHNTIDVTGQTAVNGILPVSEAAIEDIENNYPDNRFVVTTVTDLSEHFQVMLRANYYGEHYDERGRIGAESSPSAKIDPIVYLDLEVNYFYSDDLTFTAGVSNLFDTYVDEIGPPNANRLSVGLQYPRRTVANYEGGSWYLRAKYNF